MASHYLSDETELVPPALVPERTSIAPAWKWRCPVARHSAPRILPRFRLLAEIAQHRIDTALQCDFPRPDRFLYALPLSVSAQPLELFVWIEHESGPGKTPGFPRAIGMHANNIETLTCEAERKMRISGIARSLCAPLKMFPVGAIQLPELLP